MARCTLLFDLLQLPNLRRTNETNTDQTIKKQFHLLIKLFHPDKLSSNPLDNYKDRISSQALIKAYSILRSPHWRRIYICRGQKGLNDGFNPREQLERPGIGAEDWISFPAIINHIRKKTNLPPLYLDADDKGFSPPQEDDDSDSGHGTPTEEEKRREKEEEEAKARKEREQKLNKLQEHKYKLMKKLEKVLRDIDKLKNNETYEEEEEEEENTTKEPNQDEPPTRDNPDHHEPTKDNPGQEEEEEEDTGNNTSFPYYDDREMENIVGHEQKKRKDKPWELKFRTIWKLQDGSQLPPKLESLETALHHKDHLKQYLKKLRAEKQISYDTIIKKYKELAKIIIKN